MLATSDDRWTCPDCHRTTVVCGSQPDVRAALDAVMVRHANGHHAALLLPPQGPRRGRRSRAARPR